MVAIFLLILAWSSSMSLLKNSDIGVNISFDSCSGFFDIIILCQVSFFILKTSKPSFDHDIISPTTFSIHALTDTIFFYKIDILLAGKLTSLIWVQDLRFGYLKCLYLMHWAPFGYQEYHLLPIRRYSGCTSRSLQSDTEIRVWSEYM